MRKAMAAAVVALVVGAPMLPHQEVLASDRSAAGYSTKAGMKGWIGLHRPDGEVVRIKTDQIVFVMSAANTDAKTRALSRIQLLNGFADVRENVDEVMLAIRNDDVLSSLTISGETSRQFVARMERSDIRDPLALYFAAAQSLTPQQIYASKTLAPGNISPCRRSCHGDPASSRVTEASYDDQRQSISGERHSATLCPVQCILHG